MPLRSNRLTTSLPMLFCSAFVMSPTASAATPRLSLTGCYEVTAENLSNFDQWDISAAARRSTLNTINVATYDTMKYGRRYVAWVFIGDEYLGSYLPLTRSAYVSKPKEVRYRWVDLGQGNGLFGWIYENNELLIVKADKYYYPGDGYGYDRFSRTFTIQKTASYVRGTGYDTLYYADYPNNTRVESATQLSETPGFGSYSN